MNRPLIKYQTIKYPHLVAGFTSVEGCFLIRVSKANTSIGFKVELIFNLTQHSRDEQLMRSLIKYFNCGNVYKSRNTFNF